MTSRKGLIVPYIIYCAPRISEPEPGRKVVFNGVDNESGMKSNLHA